MISKKVVNFLLINRGFSGLIKVQFIQLMRKFHKTIKYSTATFRKVKELAPRQSKFPLTCKRITCKSISKKLFLAVMVRGPFNFIEQRTHKKYI